MTGYHGYILLMFIQPNEVLSILQRSRLTRSQNEYINMNAAVMRYTEAIDSGVKTVAINKTNAAI